MENKEAYLLDIADSLAEQEHVKISGKAIETKLKKIIAGDEQLLRLVFTDAIGEYIAHDKYKFIDGLRFHFVINRTQKIPTWL